LAPALLLAGCGKSKDEQVADQVAVAKEAAQRAEAAQKAAEKAARIVMQQAPPGTFGDDQMSEGFDDSGADESSDPTDSTGGMDVSADSDSGGSSSSVPE
jgi:hypothetical protein